MQSGRSSQVFQRNILPPSSGLNSKPSNQQEAAGKQSSKATKSICQWTHFFRKFYLQSAFCWLPVWLISRPWRWSQNVPKKSQCTPTRLYGALCQKIGIFIIIAVRTSTLTDCLQPVHDPIINGTRYWLCHSMWRPDSACSHIILKPCNYICNHEATNQ
jgi:hypothetical protein